MIWTGDLETEYEIGGANMLKLNEIHEGDCLELMKQIPDKSVDMILCDLPYGTTQNKWDSIIPLDELWGQYNRIIKENGAIVLTAQTPFDKVLGVSNLKMLKYEWIWDKKVGTGFLNSKRMPLKSHENILVFYKKPPSYTPQMTDAKPENVRPLGVSNQTSTNYGKVESLKASDGYDVTKRFPVTVLEYSKNNKELNSLNRLHPTQKPVALFEYLIKTYTNEGDVVLDNCIGSGTTAVAAINTNRNFIGIEMDANYCNIARTRISEAKGALV